MKQNKVVATVVTFNRKHLLLECIEALLASEFPCDILVVDNASTDGTHEYIAHKIDGKQVSYVNTGSNLGGAGGFHFAIKSVANQGYDFIWLMDDDTMVHPNSLGALLEAGDDLEGEFSYLASYVAFTDGSACKMNIPVLSSDWYKGPETSEHLIKIDHSTFVSAFIPVKSVQEVGLPLKEFFIWSDDIEYTTRLSTYRPAFLVKNSVVTHKMLVNENAGINSLITEESNRLERYFYAFRNRFYNAKKAGFKAVLVYLRRALISIVRVLLFSKKYKFKKINIILKGVLSGVSFNPSIEYLTEEN